MKAFLCLLVAAIILNAEAQLVNGTLVNGTLVNARSSIAFRSKYDSGLNATSVVMTKPSGLISGDVLLFFMTTDNDHVINSYPSGFAEIEHSTLASAGFSVAWKLAGDSEPSTYTFGFAATEAGIASLIAYSGCHSSPIDLDGINSSAGTTITTVTRTPSKSNSMLVGCTFIDNASDVVFTGVAGFPLRSGLFLSTSGAQAVADRLQTSIATEGVQIQNDIGNTWGGYTLVLRPQ